MAIEVHCQHCGKLVRAPDDSGGKHGKCPGCHQTVYIPTPPDQLEPLSLEPVDTDFERRKARMMHETAELVGKIAREKDGPEKPGDRAERMAREEKAAAGRAAGAVAGSAPARAAPAMSPAEAAQTLINYVVAMSEGKLDQAEDFAVELRQNMKAAENAMQRVMVDEILPVKLAKIPRPVIVGFFKQLREQK